jgi:hypothetical protein
MYSPVVTKDPTAVEAEVQRAYLAMFPEGDRLFVSQAFGWAIDCFTGQFPEYQQIDAKYHDFEHTLQGTLCMIRLLHRRHEAGAQPPLTPEMFRLGLLAILLHDTGYLKRCTDVKGTGAKYTVTHVARSAEFAETLLRKKHFRTSDIRSVQNMIFCTGINTVLDEIPFQSEIERIVGFALGTADLLGQMAADDYVDKLPTLYSEFAEAARHEPGKKSTVSLFTSAEDLIRKTPGFWGGYVRPKLARDFRNLFLFLSDPYPSGSNEYVERIETNMERIRRRLEDVKVPAA